MLHVEFESTLKKIATTQPTTSVCLILHNVAIKDKLFINRLEKNLKSAGLKIICKPCEKSSLQNCTNNRANKNYIIFILSNKASVLLQGHEKQDVDYINTLLNNNLDNRTYVLADKNANTNMYKKLNNFYCIENTCSKNYYFFVLKLIKLLFNTDIINETITNFISQHEAMTQQFLQEKSLLPQESKQPIKNHKLIALITKWQFVFATTFCVILIIATKSWQHFPNAARMKNSSSIKTRLAQEKIALNLPPRNTNFTGRKQALIQIKNQLNKRKLGIITQVISGLGGVGKTQLAIEFAYLAAEKEDYSAILWIPTETTNAIRNSYQEFAKYLKLDVTGLDLNSTQRLVHNKLATIYKKSKILIVLDNVPDYESINNYLTRTHKELSDYLTPHVLITSRSQHWPEASLMLDIFTQNEALNFIKKQLTNETEAKINKLNSTLQFFPLALSQAAAYIKKHTNISDYLELYTSKQMDYLDMFPENIDQHNETLWKTWNITLNKLSDIAKKMLCMSAFLEPDDIPLDFFDNLSIENKSNGIEELRKHSFIIMTNNNQSFKIHRLLQDVIKLSINHNTTNATKNKALKTNDYWLIKCMDSLNAKFEFDYLSTNTWRNWEKYLVHVLAVSKNAISLQGGVANKGLCLFIKYAMFLTYINNDSNNAVIAWEHILNAIKQHKLSSSFIEATIKTHLSNALSWSGNFHKANEILKQTIPMYKKPIGKVSSEEIELLDLLRIIPLKTKQFNKGENNCDLSFALSSLGNVLYRTGSTQEALDALYNGYDILKTNKFLNNRSNYYKIEILHKIGGIYIHLGKFLDAEKILKKAHYIGNKIYANHPKLAVIYANEAILFYHLGDFGLPP